MYLRHTIRKKNGKVHRYWRLVRSVRVGRRVIEQTVAHLGELDERGRFEARALASSKNSHAFNPTTSCCQPQQTPRFDCVASPNPTQAALLDRLGVVLPKRMRLPEQELSSLAYSD